MNENDRRTSGTAREKHQASLGLMIPSLMMAGPFSGAIAAYLITRYFSVTPEWEPRVYVICLALGIVTSGREVYRVVKRMSKDA